MRMRLSTESGTEFRAHRAWDSCAGSTGEESGRRGSVEGIDTKMAGSAARCVDRVGSSGVGTVVYA